jgi:hypothetical protein
VKRGRNGNASDIPCGFAKMDTSIPPTGLYRLRWIAAHSLAHKTWLIEITPVCLDCPCKKDVCKEMT